MLKLSYPKYTTHLMQHREIQKKLNIMLDKYAKFGASRELVLEIEKEIWGWYKDHICLSDRDFALFLQYKDNTV